MGARSAGEGSALRRVLIGPEHLSQRARYLWVAAAALALLLVLIIFSRFFFSGETLGANGGADELARGPMSPGAYDDAPHGAPEGPDALREEAEAAPAGASDRPSPAAEERLGGVSPVEEEEKASAEDPREEPEAPTLASTASGDDAVAEEAPKEPPVEDEEQPVDETVGTETPEEPSVDEQEPSVEEEPSAEEGEPADEAGYQYGQYAPVEEEAPEEPPVEEEGPAEQEEELTPMDLGGVEVAGTPESPEDKSMAITVPKMDRLAGARITSAPADDAAALDAGLLHIAGTGFPWEPEANVYIAGHRLGYPSTDSWLVFHDLNDLREGDAISLADSLGREYRYRVYDVFTVDPSDTSVMQPVEGKNIVTLQTCTLPDYKRRLIVRAEKVA